MLSEPTCSLGLSFFSKTRQGMKIYQAATGRDAQMVVNKVGEDVGVARQGHCPREN